MPRPALPARRRSRRRHDRHHETRSEEHTRRNDEARREAAHERLVRAVEQRRAVCPGPRGDVARRAPAPATPAQTVASLNVAPPDLARSTGATQSQLQWIVDAYALVFAGLPQ